jgi:tetratricopeptide (TPR) repeat protein
MGSGQETTESFDRADTIPVGDTDAAARRDDVTLRSSDHVFDREPTRRELLDWGLDIDLCGTLLAGRYLVLDRLGAGAMGVVYRAEHVAIRKLFAIKVLRTDLWRNRGAVDRFLHEARTVSQIRHEHVVEITDFCISDDGVPFFAMELLEGENLASTIAREGPLAWPRVRTIMLQLLAALEAAHQRGIIHRDVKPQNCFLVRDSGRPERLAVLDFGLAKVITEGPDLPSATRTGAVMGTPLYMSPEQARSERLDVRTDVYSAGVIAFELLTGRVPYPGIGFMAVIAKVLTEEIPRMASVAPELAIHPRVEALVRRALAKDRKRRYASAAEFAAAIHELPEELDTLQPRRQRLWRVAAAVVGLLAVGVVGWSLVPAPEHTAAAPELSIEEQAKAAYGEGSAAFQAGDHQEALRHFLRAQSLYPEPILHYNIGLCHEALGYHEQAMLAYEAYMRWYGSNPGADPAHLEMVQSKIDGLVRKLEAQKAAAGMNGGSD